ncbi:MAG TPA: rod-binding protein [Planctomycetota bacterium]|nr:rod-binding protein [Planctomycetota bacterium]
MNPITTTSIAASAPDRSAEPPAARAREVAMQFEQLFVQQMVAAMRTSTSPAGGDGMFGSGSGSDTYAAWFDRCMAEHLAHGGGIGLAPVIERELVRHAAKEAGDA